MKQWRKKFCLMALLLVCSAGSVAGDTADQQMYSQIKKAFAAYLVLSNERSGMRERQSVVLSPFGVRLKGNGLLGDNRSGMFITNFTRRHSWIVDGERKVFARIPEELDDSGSAVSMTSGIMSTQPCMDALSISKEKFDDKVLSDGIDYYRCAYDGFYTEQYFHTGFGVVVKEVYANGDKSQLMNMRPVSWGDEFFMPPPDYQEVAIEEIYVGLSSYKDPAGAQ